MQLAREVEGGHLGGLGGAEAELAAEEGLVASFPWFMHSPRRRVFH